MFKYLLAAFLALLGLWIYKRSTNRWGLPQTGFNWPCVYIIFSLHILEFVLTVNLVVGQLLELGKTGSNVAYFSKYASQFKGLYVTPLWGENVVRLMVARNYKLVAFVLRLLSFFLVTAALRLKL